jgi:hypothetical protein
MAARRVETVMPSGEGEAIFDPVDTKRLTFSGHETFAFRYGWLHKGVQLAAEDPTAFFRDDAVRRLGVGKNMVSSVRHWCQTLGLIGVDGRLKNGGVKPLGSALFGGDGFDPFLEHHGTLWLLQWQLCRRAHGASTWHYAFTRWNKSVFSRDDLVTWLLKVAEDTGDAKTSRASLKRDVDVFLRTYVPSRLSPKRAPEDSFDCPLSELGLIREVESGVYQFQRAARLSLPPTILAVALWDYWRRSAPEQRTLSFERVMYGAGSPGGAFQLSEAGMAELLSRLPRKARLTFDESAGMRRLVRQKAGDASLLELLKAYYDGAAV